MYSWASHLAYSGIVGDGDSDDHSAAPLPLAAECFLPVGFEIAVHTIGLDSGSSWSAIAILIAE